MFDLSGKSVVVTGGAGGLGRAISARLLKAGANVAVLDLDLKSGVALAEELNRTQSSGTAIALAADVTDVETLRSAGRQIAAGFGAVEILVNCAGWEQYRRFVDTDAAFRRKSVDINLFGVFNAIEVFLPPMIARKSGRIISIASEAGRIGSPGESIYAAAKAGILGLTKTLAREHGRDGITVNAICPGPFDTPLLADYINSSRSPAAFRAALEKNIPMGRIGQPQDISGLVAFLASDEARYLTGEVISVSGGLSMAG